MLAAMLSSFEETSRLLADKGVSLGINTIRRIAQQYANRADLTAYRTIPVWRVIRPAALFNALAGAQAAYHLHGR